MMCYVAHRFNVIDTTIGLAALLLLTSAMGWPIVALMLDSREDIDSY